MVYFNAFCVILQNFCVHLRNFAYTRKTFEMEIIWISVLLQINIKLLIRRQSYTEKMQSFSEEQNTLMTNEKKKNSDI